MLTLPAGTGTLAKITPLVWEMSDAE